MTIELLVSAISAETFLGSKAFVSSDSEFIKARVFGISTDTRSLKQGEIYLALKGDIFDGHNFVNDAVEKGCTAVIVEQRVEGLEVPQLVVGSTNEALSAAASLNRSLFKGVVIALTGSSGKTSTKEILKHLLNCRYKAMATKANFNNEIGVPLTLLDISDDDDFAVVEMGARKTGDISYLVEVAKPDVALLLNAGQAHIDIFGSYENIVRAKGEIYEGLNGDDIAVVNFDDPAHSKWLKSINVSSIMSFGKKETSAKLTVDAIETLGDSSRFELSYEGETVAVELPLPGLHNVSNTMAAVAVALTQGYSLKELIGPLTELKPANGRLSKHELTGITLIDDSYNANPASVKAAIDVLAVQPGIKILVLAEMAELGDLSKALHEDVAKHAKDSAVDQVFLLGEHALAMGKVIGEKALACNSRSEIVDELFHYIEQLDEKAHISVLVKGSRSMKMEEVVEHIEERAA